MIDMTGCFMARCSRLQNKLHKMHLLGAAEAVVLDDSLVSMCNSSASQDLLYISIVEHKHASRLACPWRSHDDQISVHPLS